MRKVQNFSPVKVVRYLLREHIAQAKVLLDATCGAGNDSLFLAENTPEDISIHAFDIQAEALEKSCILLKKHNLAHKVHLHLDSYVNFANYVQEPIDLIIFNLGYLPGANKHITTQVEDLQQALPQLLRQLNKQGIVCIVSYIGHLAGKQENMWLEEYLQTLNNKAFNVGKYMLFNHNNNAPIIYIIEQVKGESSL